MATTNFKISAPRVFHLLLQLTTLVAVATNATGPPSANVAPLPGTSTPLRAARDASRAPDISHKSFIYFFHFFLAQHAALGDPSGPSIRCNVSVECVSYSVYAHQCEEHVHVPRDPVPCDFPCGDLSHCMIHKFESPICIKWACGPVPDPHTTHKPETTTRGPTPSPSAWGWSSRIVGYLFVIPAIFTTVWGIRWSYDSYLWVRARFSPPVLDQGAVGQNLPHQGLENPGGDLEDQTRDPRKEDQTRDPRKKESGRQSSRHGTANSTKKNSGKERGHDEIDGAGKHTGFETQNLGDEDDDLGVVDDYFSQFLNASQKTGLKSNGSPSVSTVAEDAGGVGDERGNITGSREDLLARVEIGSPRTRNNFFTSLLGGAKKKLVKPSQAFLDIPEDKEDEDEEMPK